MHFVNCQKAFDRVKHDKLLEVMETARISELEEEFIINLYLNQQASGASSDACISQLLSINIYNNLHKHQAQVVIDRQSEKINSLSIKYTKCNNYSQQIVVIDFF